MKHGEREYHLSLSSIVQECVLMKPNPDQIGTGYCKIDQYGEDIGLLLPSVLLVVKVKRVVVKIPCDDIGARTTGKSALFASASAEIQYRGSL